ncbi:MAG: WYL domain-containing protein [Crocinitomicaceae bacterium]|nr:WYL domain-containing protein [Crocinitomicaceae bacterium]
MAQNKNALIRYRTIDKCLQNSYRTWTLDDLIEACSDVLYEYEGRGVNVSKRTIQLDIQLMRSDKLGYNAPIEVYDKKFYRYADEDYSITDIPLNENDMHVLSETVEMLKQFKDFSLFSELGGIIQRLEDKIYTEKTHQPSIIHLDKNEHLKGLNHLDILYQAILKKMVLKLTYQSFKAREAQIITFHPFILKEFNNRWFLVGKKKQKSPIMTLALDRIISIDYTTNVEYLDEGFDGDAYYENTIGVTVMGEEHVQKVVLKVKHPHSPYILTKPLHHSQRLLKKLGNGAILIELRVHHNFELERIILGFGEGIHVIEPPLLKQSILSRLQNGLDLYRTEMSRAGLKRAQRSLSAKGHSILNDIYTQREVKKISTLLHKYFADSDEATYGKRTLLMDLPALKPFLLNENLLEIVHSIDPKAFLTKAIFFDKPQTQNWAVGWHQDVPINVKEKITIEGFTSWTLKKGINCVCPPEELLHSIFTIRVHLDDTAEQNGALKVIPGSHKRRFSDDEINTITTNSNPSVCEVKSGGVHLLKPLLLHSSPRATSQKKRRVIHLEFCSTELPKEMEWLEREDL